MKEDTAKTLSYQIKAYIKQINLMELSLLKLEAFSNIREFYDKNKVGDVSL